MIYAMFVCLSLATGPYCQFEIGPYASRERCEQTVAHYVKFSTPTKEFKCMGRQVASWR